MNFAAKKYDIHRTTIYYQIKKQNRGTSKLDEIKNEKNVLKIGFCKKLSTKCYY